jgi:WD40 repeat protein
MNMGLLMLGLLLLLVSLSIQLVRVGACWGETRGGDDRMEGRRGKEEGRSWWTVSPDGKLVAAGSLDTMVRVWNVTTGQQLERLKGHKDSVYRYVISSSMWTAADE